MIFLIQYDRTAGAVISLQTFSDGKQEEAAEARLALEIDLLNERKDGEVIVLEAESEEALRKTHRRYFENLRTLLDPGRAGSSPVEQQQSPNPTLPQ